MKYYIIAGEASGDLHGSNLMKALKQKDSDALFRFWGGDLMQSVDSQLVKHYKDLAFMGVIEVVKNIRTILGNIKFCKKDILSYQPDVIIFIDYPGFNLRIAKWAKRKSLPTFYYISPQIWAWRSSRAYKIKAAVDQMFVILPFEKAFYKQYDYDVHFVGHPLLDVIKPKQKNNISTKSKTIAFLPGSRIQEIKKSLPEFLTIIPHFKEYNFVIAGATAVDKQFYKKIVENAGFQFNEKLKLLRNKTYHILQNASAALVTSGTATLETALFGVPQIVCYKGNPIAYFFAMKLIKVPFISLVNLILEKEVVKELIQNDFNTQNLISELNKILDPQHAASIQKDYSILREKLGNAGASVRTAELITNSPAVLRTSPQRK